MSLIPNIISSELASAFSTLAAAEIHSLVHLSFNSILQLINGILSDLQKLLKCFNGMAIAAFFKIKLFPLATVSPYNLVLCSKNLKALWFAISASKSVASSLELNQELPIVSEQFELYSFNLYICIIKSNLLLLLHHLLLFHQFL